MLFLFIADFVIIDTLLLPQTGDGKGGIVVRLQRFLEAVVASVVAYYLCKWLDMLLRGLSN